MKQLIGRDIGNYAFAPANNKVTIIGVSLSQEQILTVTNTTSGVMFYCFADSTLGGAIANSVLTVNYNCSAMNVNDSLQIYVDIPDIEYISGELGRGSTLVNDKAQEELLMQILAELREIKLFMMGVA